MQVLRRFFIWAFVSNSALAAAKLTLGFAYESDVMLADGVNSLSDVLSDSLIICAHAWSKKPRDDDHPYGHGKIETLANACLAVILLDVALHLTWRAWVNFGTSSEGEALPGLIVAALVFGCVQEYQFRRQKKYSQALASPLILSNAWHYRTDAWGSFAAAFGLFGSWLGFASIESIAFLCIVGILLWVALGMLKSSIHELLEGSVEESELRKIEGICRATEGVLSCHELRARRFGSHIHIEIHLVVDGKLSLFLAHDIAEDTEERIRAAFPKAKTVLVHLDPVDDLERDQRLTS